MSDPVRAVMADRPTVAVHLDAIRTSATNALALLGRLQLTTDAKARSDVLRDIAAEGLVLCIHATRAATDVYVSAGLPYDEEPSDG